MLGHYFGTVNADILWQWFLNISTKSEFGALFWGCECRKAVVMILKYFNKISVWSIILVLGMQKCHGNESQMDHHNRAEIAEMLG